MLPLHVFFVRVPMRNVGWDKIILVDSLHSNILEYWISISILIGGSIIVSICININIFTSTLILYEISVDLRRDIFWNYYMFTQFKSKWRRGAVGGGPGFWLVIGKSLVRATQRLLRYEGKLSSSMKQRVILLSEKLYPNCLVQVSSRNGFVRDFR